jgi:HPt (histidine-containing phosphotransfer) domain-containing protein
VSKLAACLKQWLGADEATVPDSGFTTEPAPVDESVPVPSDVFRYDDLLALMMGDDALAETLLDMFVTNMPGDIEKLTTAIGSGDGEAVRSAAHFIKGAAANLCAPTLNVRALEIEKAGKQNDSQLASELLASLQLAWLAFLKHPKVVERIDALKVPTPGPDL